MTLIAAARLAMDLLFTGSSAVVALVLIKQTGWRSLLPAAMMGMVVARLERVNAPSPPAFALAVAAWVVVLVTLGPGRRMVRAGAVIACSVSAATVQIVDRL